MRDLLYHPIIGLIKIWQTFVFVIIYLFEKPLISMMKKEYARIGINIIDVDQLKKMDNKKMNPWDIKVYNKKFYRKVMLDGGIGVGSSYICGMWSSDQVDVYNYMLCRNKLFRLYMDLPWNKLIQYLKYEFFNLQTGKRAFQVGREHYDLGNALFESFLDKNMNYTCGYWSKNAKDLDEAQLHKMDLIAKKLNLKPGMRVLDIGCGFGNMCKFLAENYFVTVVGITVSVEQAKLGQERCKGLPKVEIRVADYRDINEKFDRVLSIGCMEHVGRQNYRTFFNVASQCLKDDDGLFLLHTIGLNDPHFPTSESWTATAIFPNGRIPRQTEIAEGIDGLFVIEDWHNFGPDYDKTLMAWHANFVKNWPTIKHLFKDSEQFYRLWTFYLLTCAGSFRARQVQLWQVVLSKNGISGGYISVR